MITRRKLIGSIGLLMAAPAIIRVATLMPVKAFKTDHEITEKMILDAVIYMKRREIPDPYLAHIHPKWLEAIA